MKILKPGILIDDVQFTCKICGCEFKANRTEYYIDYLRKTNDKRIHIAKCECPTCRSLCSIEINKE